MERGDSGEFKVHILERGTKFVEKIKIDEDNDIEYFHVPAHNGLTEADYLYDFRSVSAQLCLPTLMIKRIRFFLIFFTFRIQFQYL